MALTYATLCSGIEGFGRGFDDAGLTPVYQCERDKQCLSVLRRHYPNVPKGDDVNGNETATDIARLRPGIVAFGSPCQDLSVAGKRGGLAGERSGLFFRCVELCFTCEAPVVVWENVPGVLSSAGGEDFASVLEAFTGFRPSIPKKGWRNSGVCVGPLYSVAWAVLDAQWFGVPQRRRRVFVVGHLGDRAFGYKVLSLGESLPWDSPPRRQAGARIAASLTRGADSSGRGGYAGRRREDDFNIVGGGLEGPAGIGHCADVAGTLNANFGRKQGLENQHIDNGASHFVTHTLRAEGHDASEGGTGRGVPLVPVVFNWQAGGTQSRLGYDPESGISGSLHVGQVPAVAYQSQGGSDDGEDACGRMPGDVWRQTCNCGHSFTGRLDELCPSCGMFQGGYTHGDPIPINMRQASRGEKMTNNRRDGSSGGAPGTGIGDAGDPCPTITDSHTPAIAFTQRTRDGAANVECSSDVSFCLDAPATGGRKKGGVVAGMGVRRLTPRECERLQGFDDDHTRFADDGSEISDSARYRMCGNSIAVPVARWIANRIVAVLNEQQAAPPTKG